MPNIITRQLRDGEMLDVMYVLNVYAFRASPPMYNQIEWQELVRQRQGVTYLALYEDHIPVAGAAATSMIQNVRGTLYPMGGIWGVATDPGARRKGYSRNLLTDLLSTIRDQGVTLSCLYPFRESFYERLGYVTFPLTRSAKLNPLNLAPLLDIALEGEIERILIGDGFDTYRGYLQEMIKRTHGMALFKHADTAAAQRNQTWLAFAKFDGQLEGLMMYDLRGEEVTEFNLRAVRFYYQTSRARYLLLAWIARHIDQANRAEIWLAPFEMPETWLADLQVSLSSAPRAAMGRVLDVAQIGGMQTGPGCFSAQITDPVCPWNETIWHFETMNGILFVNRGKRADCSLTIQALGALIYGTHDPQDFPIRGWGNPSPDIQEVMRTMFPQRLAYIHEYF